MGVPVAVAGAERLAMSEPNLHLKRMGDYYEAYGEDAKKVSKALNVTLTGRCIDGVRVDMAWIPAHALERCWLRLIECGFVVKLEEAE